MKNSHRRLNIRLLCGAGAAAILAMASIAHAEVRQFDIPSQSLGEALAKFGSQSDLTIVSTSALTRSKNSQAITGAIEPEMALAQLLNGTGLTYRREGDTFLIVSASDPQSGSAAGDGADGTVQALIVTAQKREEDIQDVPIAISAFTQEDLTRSQVAGGPDLVTQVPNFTFTKTNFSSYSIQIRGIGTQAISATTDPAVAVAFNNTPFIRNRFFEQEFYDLERVEVLRGPQGTLYGRNATGGVVNIISAKPKFIYEAKLSADVGNFSSSRLEGMVNIPLVEDKVALRVAGAWTKRDGYATNELTGNPIDGRDLWSTRLSLRFQPTDWINTNLVWEHFEEDDDRLRSGKQLCDKDYLTQFGGFPIVGDPGWPNPGNDIPGSRVQSLLSQGCKRASLYAPESFQTPNGYMLPYYLPLGAIFLPTALDDPYVRPTQSQNLRMIESTVDPGYRAKSDIFELQASIDLSDKLSLSSETSYSTDFIFSTQDFNRFNTQSGAWDQEGWDSGATGGLSNNFREGVLNDGFFCDPQIGCSDRLVGVDLSTARSRQFSQELRLASDFEGRFNFSLGANFLRYDTVEKYYVFFNSLSLYAAISPGFHDDQLLPYEAGSSDNIECLRDGPVRPTYWANVTSCIYIDPNPITNLNDKGHNYFLSKNPYKLISYAVFGEAYYKLADNLKVTAGLRWTVDKKEAPLIPSQLLAAQSVGYIVADVIDQEWREPTGRLAIDWKPDLSFTDETLIYGSYAHGYKAGGANPPRPTVTLYSGGEEVINTLQENSATHPRTFDPEFVDAFELGAKNTMLDGRLTANFAGFYYDYKGYQISEIVDRSALNRNFDATVWGLELESDWRPFENLRLGFKGGYEKTRIADGEKAVDLMDRTAGDPNWAVVRPFPTNPSSCILPTDMFARTDGVYRVGNIGGGGDGPCELAYLYNLDPVTGQAYDPDTLITNQGFSTEQPYRGFDPQTAPNHGEGIDKPLGGNELPNAPHFTATVTGDYTLPLANEWLMTLHSDVHWQSQSWWRVFNDHVYDKLHPYFTMNLAAIFTNEERGWNIMAYVKNVTDETALTGAFLNSDDTGLTTNVFLTEPRLYGLRVTKSWSGGPLLGNFGARHDGPYPFTVELGGQIERHDAPYETVEPTFAGALPASINVIGASQHQTPDWGDGREVKITYRPASGPWTLMAGYRRGDTNTGTSDVRAEAPTETVCAFGGDYAFFCVTPDRFFSRIIWTNASSKDRERHELADFALGRDAGFGKLKRASVQAGLRYADLFSQTGIHVDTLPDFVLKDGFVLGGTEDPNKTRYIGDLLAEREFKGMGPVLTWEASYPALEGEFGDVGIDWSLSGGVLFGKQKTTLKGDETQRYYVGSGIGGVVFGWVRPTTVIPTKVDVVREHDISAPVVSAKLGLSYNIDRVSVGAGYRWERYFDVLDVGQGETKKGDRTIDGPYFKIAVGFGG